MGLFDSFKKKPAFSDDVFGELEYTTFSDAANNFYTGKVSIESAPAAIMLAADGNGPTPAQKDFFIKLRDDYASIKTDIIIPFLKSELEDWIAEQQITDLENQFEIDTISLPRITEKPVEWTLTFYALDMQHYVTIEFTDRKPQDGMIIDG